MTFSPRQNSGGILLLSSYELGRQPLSLAWPLAVLHQSGFPAQAFDLSVQSFPEDAVARAAFVGISAPMHTALRLGAAAASRVRDLNPNAHINFYGLYAGLNKEYLLDGLANSILAGESEASLVALIRALDAGRPLNGIPGLSTPSTSAAPNLVRPSLPIPERGKLPHLEEYAHYNADGVHTLAGYVESSRGCLHTCTHCPITPVYNGRFFVIPAETVLGDIRRQVEAGAGHITFGDPDFLNGPGHALKIARQLHAEFPGLTFDFTAKVEHIVRHRKLFPELAALGCTFVTSAFESTSDRILARLDKGHSLADMHTALEILASAGIAVQPTWMPFTPWTRPEDYLHMLAWIRENGLIPHVPPVQLSIRMLVPPGSALIDHHDAAGWLGTLDAPNFTYRWRHPDALMDELQTQITALVENASADISVFNQVEAIAYRLAGEELPPGHEIALDSPPPPRLTEHWFC